MIVGAQVLLYELPFREPVLAGDGVYESRSGLLLGLIDSEGATGWGEAAPLPGFSGDSFAQAEAGLRGLVATIEERPRDRKSLLPTTMAWLSRLPSAAAALDCALLDLESRLAGVSLAAHLLRGGAVPDFVPVNALIAGERAEDVAAAATTAVSEGFTAFKLKVGARTPEEDLERISALRDAIGPAASLRVDAGGRWTPDVAVQVLTAAAGYDLEYVEDPVADLDALVQVGAAVDVPVAVDALLARSSDPLAVVSTAVVDVFVLKPSALGGLSVTASIAARARERGRRVVVTSFFESAVGLTAAVHLAASLAQEEVASGLATSYLFSSNVAEPPPVVAGRIRVPPGPGLGVAPSEVGAPDLAEGGPG